MGLTTLLQLKLDDQLQFSFWRVAIGEFDDADFYVPYLS